MRHTFDARSLLRRHGIRPRKRLGQHFLVDQHALQAVTQAAELDAADRVLEIGAGLGSLTVVLAKRASQVVAVELDPRLLPALLEVLGSESSVSVIQGDILQLDPAELMSGAPYLVVANIPYNITSALIRQLTEARPPPSRIVLTVQLEVAQRALAQPGSMNLLALSVQIFGTASIEARIPARAFYPAPAVESAVLRIAKHDSPRVGAGLAHSVFGLARAGFSQRRKMLKNSIAAGLQIEAGAVVAWLDQAGIGANARAQELSLEDWVRLTEAAAPTAS